MFLGCFDIFINAILTMAAHTVDDYLNNATWVAHMKSLFDFVDLNKNGTMD